MIATNLQGILYAKEAIKAAILAKGVTVPAAAKLADCPGLIAAISTGNNGEFPVEGAGPVCVTFIDYTGRVLKKHYGNAGFNATAPSDPAISGMVFAGWNISFANVQFDTVVGALFYTASGKLEIDVVKNTYTGGLVQTLRLYKDDASLMTVEWGDGNVSTSSATGAVTFTNTLAVAGNYTVKVAIAAGGVYKLWSGTNGTGIFGQTSATPNYACLEVRLPQTGISVGNGGNSGLGNSALYYCTSLRAVSIYGNFTTVGDSFANRSSQLKGLVLPSTVALFGYQCFYGCDIEYVTLPPGLFTNNATFSVNRRLTSVGIINSATSASEVQATGVYKLIYSSNLSSINVNSLSGCDKLRSLTLLSTTPPALANVNAFASVPISCVFYVRKNTAALYAAGTNWNVIYTQYQFVELNN